MSALKYRLRWSLPPDSRGRFAALPPSLLHRTAGYPCELRGTPPSSRATGGDYLASTPLARQRSSSGPLGRSGLPNGLIGSVERHLRIAQAELGVVAGQTMKQCPDQLDLLLGDQPPSPVDRVGDVA
jgi:hypothetical protein